MPKILSDVFFRLKHGEFITYTDGKDRKVQFKLHNIGKEMLQSAMVISNEMLKKM